MAVGTYLGLTLVFSIFKEYPMIGKLLTYGGMIVAVVLFLRLAGVVFWWFVELVLIIFGVERERRKEIIEELQMSVEGTPEDKEWDEASFRNWLGKEYRLMDSSGNLQELRRKSDGTFLDRKGNYYKEVTFWDRWKKA